jgi:hypothetical protein
VIDYLNKIERHSFMRTIPIYFLRVICFTFIILLSGLSHAQDSPSQVEKSTSKDSTDQAGSYKPMLGTKVASTKYGDVNLRFYTYVRYLNQLGLESEYTNSFGQTSTIKKRQDVQLQKALIFFGGWFLQPKFRYLLYVWTNNTAQGQLAQVVVAGLISYNFNKHFTLVGGTISLPGVRSTDGQFPMWLSVDNRMISDEFFRPSYTMGIGVKGKIVEKLDYQIMIGNNLSQLGIDAGQLDNQFNTVSAALNYFPTTGEYGMMNSSFGDYENHQEAASRLGAHFTRSDEDRQGQPTNSAFDNVQIRLSDGSVIFAPDLFGAGTQIDKARYQMTSFDAGVKYHGFALEGEYYWRWIDNFRVTGPPLTIDQLFDNGFQLQASGMLLPQTLQLYLAGSKIFGEYGDPWELRAGLNWFPFNNRYARFNAQYIYTNKSPVGGLAYPFTVGGTGSVYTLDFEINY